MKMNRLAWLAIALTALVMGGCSSTGDKDGEGSKGTTAGANAGASTSAAGAGKSTSVNPLADPYSPLATRKVYFDFDQSTIRSESVSTLRAHAAFLVKNNLLNVTIEGHADERGSREYNIGLGERRATAVKRFLEAEGVNSSQINTISYGEERPDQEGHNESAWAANRRAVIVY